MPKSEDLKKRYPLLFSETENSGPLQTELYQSAWQEARKACAILKNEFGAGKVLVFGSLTDPSSFDENSDIDLAVLGIPDEKFYAAVGAVTNLVRNFKIDLVDIADCKEYLKKEIEKDGIEI
jgi:uncharacterized protein